MDAIPRLSDFVDSERLWRRTLQIAEIGRTPTGGCRRLAFSKEEGAARAAVIGWAKELGAICLTDAIGNLFLRFESSVSQGNLPPVMTGSHLDTEPDGGRFDGVFGVLAGLEAASAIRRAGTRLSRALEVVVWSNEEGCRFQPGCMGSSAHTDPSKLESLLAIQDRSGVAVQDAMAAMTSQYEVDVVRKLGAGAAAFVEAHIEQGPIMEELGADIGVVSAIYGSCRIGVEVMGETAHAGTSPRRSRRDAFVSAVQMVSNLHATLFDDDDVLRFTIGQFLVAPGSPSVVPDRVTFTIDMRHPEQSALDRYREKALRICRNAVAGCRSTAHEIIRVPCVGLDRSMQKQIARSSNALGLRTHELASGAGHDSRNLAANCPTAMIFVPSRRGISHNPNEYTSPEQLANGARVLAEVIYELARA